jgi:hypothetical protein
MSTLRKRNKLKKTKEMEMKTSRILTVAVVLTVVVWRVGAIAGEYTSSVSAGGTALKVDFVDSVGWFMADMLFGIKCEYGKRCISQADVGKCFQAVVIDKEYITLKDCTTKGLKYFRYHSSWYSLNDTKNYPYSSSCNGYCDDARSSSGSTSSYSGSTSTGTVHVKGYYRKDGTYVKPHTRRRRK